MTQTGSGSGFADDSGRYRLESRIATGGMGEVWRATDTVLGRPVAVKLLKSEYADDTAFRVRFESEAQHAASLHHPNIATVYDFGEARTPDGATLRRPYLVMELVDGQPLSALLRPGVAMDPAAVRDLLAQAADGLGAAHEAGIVHRDVKPANLLVTPDRTVKVTDFGIARAAEGVGLTSTGEVMGTPQYLSPEQAQGRPASPASDVYSLGVVAFECLAGRRPFQAESPVATALAHVRDEVPDLPRSVPDELAHVVRRAMAKAPEARFRDGHAMARALRDPVTAATQVVPPPVVTAPPPTPAPTQATSVMAPVPAAPAPAPTTTTTAAAGSGSRRWVGALLAVVALVVIAVLVVLLLTRGDGDDTPGDDTSGSPTPTSSAPSSPDEPTSSAPDQTVRIDESDYLDRPLRDVQRELADLGLRVDTQRQDNPGDQIEGDVMSVNPTGALDRGDTVTVGFWGPVTDTETPSETPSDTPSESPSDTSSPSSPESPSS